jgi:hypothetical protein
MQVRNQYEVADFQQTMQQYVPEDGTLRNHCFENLRS